MLRRRELLTVAAGACFAGAPRHLSAQAIQTPAPRGDDVSDEARQLRRARWEPRRAFEYMARFGVVKGCNFVLADAGSLWEESNRRATDRELGWAQDVSLNSVRVFVSSLLFEDQGEKLYPKIDSFLSVCEKHGISVMPVLAVGAIRDPAYTPPANAQPRPEVPFRPGVHGGGPRPPRPGLLAARQNLELAKPVAQRFVQGMLRRYGRDPRIIAWDLFNEPWREDRPLVEHMFACARESGPSQPLSACWQGEDLSDVYNFHTYGKPGKAAGAEPDLLPFDVELKLAVESDRPLLCTECLARTFGNTFQAFLPHFAKYHVGWYIWGLCAGTAQHHYPWHWPVGSPEPKNWFHCILYPDGTPYREEEIELIRNFRYEDASEYRSRPQFRTIG